MIYVAAKKFLNLGIWFIAPWRVQLPVFRIFKFIPCFKKECFLNASKLAIPGSHLESDETHELLERFRPLGKSRLSESLSFTSNR
jgi:hypothetical protein